MINDLLGIPAQISQNYLGDLRSDSFLPFRAGDRGVSLWAQGQRLKQYNLYAQDEWRVRKDLTINYGVRWEINPAPTEAGGRVYVPDRSINGSAGPVTFVQADRWYKRNNFAAFAPRLGVAWSPFGQTRSVIRAGYGLAYDPISSFQVTAVAVRVPGQSFRCVSTVGGATTPGCATAPDRRLGQGFPSELPPPTARPSSFLTPPAQTYNNAPNVTVFDPNMMLPTVHMWNLTYQREVGAGFVTSIGYVGRRGTRLYRSFDANQINAQPILGSFRAMQSNLAIANCRPDGTLANNTACPGAQAVPIVQSGLVNSAFVNSALSITDLRQNAAGNMAGRIDQISVATSLASRLRPNPQFQRITYLDNGGDSNYHSMQFAFRKRFDAAGLLTQGSYTLGKSIDNQSLDPVGAATGGGLGSTAVRTPVDANNFGLERARSDFDQRHVVNVTGVYEMPFGKGKKFGASSGKTMNLLIGDWSINGFTTFQSGEPYSIRSGVLTHNFSAQSRATLAPGVTTLPQSQLQEAPGVVGPVFFRDASAFTIPAAGEVGLGRNIFQGPNFWNVDLGISKGFQVTERVRVALRTEMFNALNRPNFRNPRDASVGSPSILANTFAQACCVTLSTASSTSVNQNGESWRVIQFALKLTF
jgi:hypothetical protein